MKIYEQVSKEMLSSEDVIKEIEELDSGRETHMAIKIPTKTPMYLLLGEMMLRFIAYIFYCWKEDVEDHVRRDCLVEDHSSLLGEMMQRIISSFSGRDNLFHYGGWELRCGQSFFERELSRR